MIGYTEAIGYIGYQIRLHGQLHEFSQRQMIVLPMFTEVYVCGEEDECHDDTDPGEDAQSRVDRRVDSLHLRSL